MTTLGIIESLLTRLLWPPMFGTSMALIFTKDLWSGSFVKVAEFLNENITVFVIAAFVGGFGCAWELWLWLKPHLIKRYRDDRKRENLIRNLTKIEKDILKMYIELDVTGLSFEKKQSSTLYSLSKQDLIYLLDQNGDVPGPNNEIFPPGFAYSYNLEPWVRQVVKNKPQLLD